MRRAIVLTILLRLYRWVAYHLPMTGHSGFDAGNRQLFRLLHNLIRETLEGTR